MPVREEWLFFKWLRKTLHVLGMYKEPPFRVLPPYFRLSLRYRVCVYAHEKGTTPVGMGRGRMASQVWANSNDRFRPNLGSCRLYRCSNRGFFRSGERVVGNTSA